LRQHAGHGCANGASAEMAAGIDAGCGLDVSTGRLPNSMAPEQGHCVKAVAADKTGKAVRSLLTVVTVILEYTNHRRSCQKLTVPRDLAVRRWAPFPSMSVFPVILPKIRPGRGWS